jgi:hypothetical protein
MRTTIFKLVAALGSAAAVPEPIYEFGAYRVPGQEGRGDVRSCFPGRRFIGCDRSAGLGVDEIQDLHHLTLPDNAIGTALLLDTIEHVREPFRATAELYRCLQPGGLLMMTSVMYFPIHLHPDDYWRFTGSGFASLVQAFDDSIVEMIGLRTLPHTVVAAAFKKPVSPAFRRAVSDVMAAWKRRGAQSWKEVLIALAPPVLLMPAYDLYVAWLQRGQGRRE